MSRKKLSHTQREVLKELATDGAVARYMPYMGSFRPVPYWFIHANGRGMLHVRWTTMDALITAGYVRRDDGKGFNDTTGYITDAGRAAIWKLVQAQL